MTDTNRADYPARRLTFPLTLDQTLQIILVGLLIATVIVVLLTAGVGFTRMAQREALGGDQGLWAEMARVHLRGGLLYADIWNTKPPVMFWMLAPFISVFGNTVTAISAATLVMNALFVLALTALAYAVTRSWLAGGIGGLIALLYAANQPLVETTFLMAAWQASAIALILLARGRPALTFVSGVLFVFGFFTKQPLATEFPILLAFAWFAVPTERRRQSVAGVIAGCTVGSLLMGGWLIGNGILDEYIQHIFGTSAHYVLGSDGGWHFRGDSQALFSRFFMRSTFPWLRPLIGFGLLAAIAVFITRRQRTLLWLILGWLLLAVVGASIARAFKPAYFNQTLPAFIALIALSIPVLRRWHVGAQVVILAAALLTMHHFGARFVKIYDDWRPDTMQTELEVAAYMAQRTQPDDCIWSWGHIGILNYLADRGMCHSAPINGFMMDSTAFPIIPNRIEFMQQLHERPPTLHVTAYDWGYFPELEKYAERYLVEPAFRSDDYHVFRVDTSALRQTQANFNDEIALIAYDLPPQRHHCPGMTLDMALTWQALTPPAHEYQFFAQVLTEDETARVAGFDGLPADDRPTYSWGFPGEIILSEPFTLSIPADTPTGTYKIAVGLYEVESLERSPVLNESGAQVGTYAVLQTLTLADQCPS